MILVGSFWRKAVVSAIAASCFVFLFEVTMLDWPNFLWLPGRGRIDPAVAGTRNPAVVYCDGLIRRRVLRLRPA